MKKLLVWFCVIVFLPSVSNGQPFESLPAAGSMTWGDWEFAWEIGDVNQEGLVVKNIRFKNIAVIRKASMPVVRVKYRGKARRITSGCGPFLDRIRAGNIERLPGTTSDVVARTFGDNREIAVFAEIGGYDLYQAWYFDKSGRFEPRLYSRGWSCDQRQHEKDHKHHPYWRIDFNVEATGSNFDNELWTIRTKTDGQVQIVKAAQEGNDWKAADDADLGWTINRPGSSKHVLIRHPGNEMRDAPDTPWFSFSNKETAWRRYKPMEDSPWEFSSTQHLGYMSPAENVEGKDIVFWVVGHLSHEWNQSDEANPVWHWIGPTIDVKW